MKKTMKLHSIVTLALMGIMMAGCSKGNDIIDQPQQPEKKDHVVTLTTTVGFEEAAGGTRALDINYGANTITKTFAAGEQIAVVYENTSNTMVKAESVTLKSEDLINGGLSAKITVTLTNPKPNGTVKYIYPAAMAGETDVDYTKLATQDGTRTTIASNYDLAVFEGTLTGEATLPASSNLKNKLAIIAYTIKDADGSNDRTSGITGMTINDGTHTYFINGHDSDGHIYVALQPTNGANIQYTAFDDTRNYKKSVTGKTYEANNFYQQGLRMTELERGQFTVAVGTKVAFAPGNLQATYNGSTWNWHLAANQWDCIGDATGNTKVTDSSPFISENATVDLFGWSTNTTTFGIHSSNVGTTYSGAFKEWGNNIGTGWRTLSQAEWTYLLNTRSTTSTIRYAKATVNSINGIILLPDDWSTSYHSLNSINSAEANYSTNTVTSDNWVNDFEAHGAVFLPAAGDRSGVNVVNEEQGFYWSSTSAGEYNAYNVHFTSSALFPSADFSRATGCSVRLVRDL